MIELPDFSKNWEYENGFYLTSDNSRIGKILAHYELFKMTKISRVRLLSAAFLREQALFVLAHSEIFMKVQQTIRWLVLIRLVHSQPRHFKKTHHTLSIG